MICTGWSSVMEGVAVTPWGKVEGTLEYIVRLCNMGISDKQSCVRMRELSGTVAAARNT